VVPSTFLVQLPGLVGGNEFLQLTAAELQLLNQKQPGLMSSEGVMIQEATPEILSTLNPAQINTTSNLNIKRMFTDLGVTLPESSVGAEGPSNRALAFEKLKEQLSNLSFFPERTEGTVDTGPGFFSPENNAVRLSAVKELMFGPEEQQAPQQQTMTEGSVVNPSLLSGNNFSNDPTTGYSYPTDIVANMMPPQTNTPPVESGITSLPVTPENQNIADNLRFDFLDNFKINTTDGRTPSLRNDMVKMAGDFSEAERMLLNAPRSNVLPALESLSDEPVSDFARRGLLPVGSVDINAEYADILTKLNSDTLSDNERRAFEIRANEIERTRDYDKRMQPFSLENVKRVVGNALKGTGDLVSKFNPELGSELLDKRLPPPTPTEVDEKFEELRTNRNFDPGVGGPEVTSEAIDKAVKEAEKEKALAGAVDPGVGGPEVTSKAIEAAMKISVDADKLNPQGPNFVLNPDKIKKDLDEGGSGSNALLNVEIDKKLSPKESVKEFQSMYKEMLGMDDEDKEKEKWHQMAMIGFAIAAGQDPSALANIAGGLLEGTKMMKADRVRKQDRADKITIMAIQAADQERRDAIAAGATVDAANLKYNRDIELIEKRAGIATETAAKLAETQKDAAKLKAEAVLEAARLEQANTSFLGTDRGKEMANIFSTNPTLLSDKEKLAEMSQTFDESSMNRFRSAMGIVGTGVTGSGSKEVTLEDIKL
jgi:hypothetical protein